MGGGNSHDTLKESSILYPEQVQTFQNTFKQIVQTQKNLSFPALQGFFPLCCEKLLRRIFTQIQKEKVHQGETAAPNEITFGQLFTFMEKLQSNDQIILLFSMYAEKDVLEKETFKQLFYDVALIGEINLVLSGHQPASKLFVKTNYDLAVNTIFNSIKTSMPMTIPAWNEFCSNTMPNIGKALEYLFWYKFLRNPNPRVHTEQPTNVRNNNNNNETKVYEKPVFPPLLTNIQNSKIKTVICVHWILSLMSDCSLNQSWDVIYAASTAGFSLSSLLKYTQGYLGPTILLIQTTNGNLIGSCQSINWNSTSMYQKDTSSFLFTLFPKLSTFKHKGGNGNDFYIFNNVTTRSKLRLGIGLGIVADNEFRVFIDKDLQNAQATIACNSFETGPLIPQATFEILDLEIWGCGGPKASQEQQKFKNSSTLEADKRNRMQAKGSWDGPDRFIMDFTGKTVSSDILAGIHKGDNGSSSSGEGGVIHFGTGQRGNFH